MTLQGDTTRFEDDERLDIPDADSFQTLVYAYLARVLGGLLGPCGGTFSRTTFTSSDSGGNPVIDIGEGLFFGAFDITSPGSRFAEGVLLSHDPTLPDQTSRVNAATFEAGSEEPYIWAALSLLESDIDSRRKWNVLTSQEEAFSPKTRVRQRVMFQLKHTKPIDAADSDWFQIGQITSWSGSGPALPTVTLIHPLDNSVNIIADDTEDTKRKLVRIFGNNGVMGLAEMNAWILDSLLGIKDSAATGVTNPNSSNALNQVMARGLFQLNVDLLATDAVQQAIETGQYRVILSGGVAYIPPYTPEAQHPLDTYPTGGTITLTKLNVGEMTITCPGKVLTVHVTPFVGAGSPPPGIQAFYSVALLSYAAGPNESTFKIWIYDKDVDALADLSFFVTAFGDPTP